jgi:hypothetical protein
MPQIIAEYIMGFLKILTSLHTWLAAETHLADGEFLQAAAAAAIIIIIIIIIII